MGELDLATLYQRARFPSTEPVLAPAPAPAQPVTSGFALHVADRVDPDGSLGASYVRDPRRWVEERAKEELWSGQVEILEDVRDHRRVAVKSCHGVGKSHIASRVAAWWLDVHPPGEAFVVTTAPSFPQVRAILWRYIRQIHKRASLPGRVNQTEWILDDDIVAYGRKPADYDETAFQGIHARYVLVLIDEACGIPLNLWIAIDTLLTNDHCRVLAIGNPDNPETHFKRICEANSGWHVKTINAFDSPNFTDEEVSPALAEQLVNEQWVADAAKNWGEDSPLYVSKVLAEFPEDADDGIIPGSKVAHLRVGDPPELDDAEADVQLGVDVGAGGDKSVIRERRGDVAGRVWRSQHDDPELLTAEVLHAIRETDACRVAIDVIGIGWGIVGSVKKECREDPALKRVEVLGVNVGAAATEPKRFKNLKAELWWVHGRERVQADGMDLRALDDQTAADLTAPRYHLDTRGRIVVESKDDVRARLGRSPDDADALLLAYYTRRTKPRVHKPTDLHAQVFSGTPRRATVNRQ